MKAFTSQIYPDLQGISNNFLHPESRKKILQNDDIKLTFFFFFHYLSLWWLFTQLQHAKPICCRDFSVSFTLCQWLNSKPNIKAKDHFQFRILKCMHMHKNEIEHLIVIVNCKWRERSILNYMHVCKIEMEDYIPIKNCR